VACFHDSLDYLWQQRERREGIQWVAGPDLGQRILVLQEEHQAVSIILWDKNVDFHMMQIFAKEV